MLPSHEEVTAFQKLSDSITSDDTMAFFEARKPIVVRTEASFHELSAGLFQRTVKGGLQQDHYTCISRSVPTAEIRYNQTEKDALAVKWAKSRFSMYLLGAPKIIILHKPLIPVFNKSCTKLPPTIKR